jgi:hypothetical protein
MAGGGLFIGWTAERRRWAWGRGGREAGAGRKGGAIAAGSAGEARTRSRLPGKGGGAREGALGAARGWRAATDGPRGNEAGGAGYPLL